MDRREFLAAISAAGVVGVMPSALALPDERDTITVVKDAIGDLDLWQILENKDPVYTLAELRTWLKWRYNCTLPEERYNCDGSYQRIMPSFRASETLLPPDFHAWQHKVARYGAVSEELLPLLVQAMQADFTNGVGRGETVFFRYAEMVRLHEDRGNVSLFCRFSVLA